MGSVPAQERKREKEKGGEGGWEAVELIFALNG